MPELERLPALLIPAELHGLVEALKNQDKVSMSAIVRDLIKESPRVVALAKERGIDLSELKVSTWGGARTQNQDDPELSAKMEKAKVVVMETAEQCQGVEVYQFYASTWFGFNADFSADSNEHYMEFDAAIRLRGLSPAIERYFNLESGRRGFHVKIDVPKEWQPPATT